MLFPQEAQALPPEPPEEAPPSKIGILQWVLLAVGAIYVIFSLYLLYDMRTRIVALEQKEQKVEAVGEQPEHRRLPPLDVRGSCAQSRQN